MIFIGLILFIAAIVMALNFMDNNNLEKIKHHLEAKECSSIYYGYGSYKGLCPKELRVVKNSFILDIANNEKVIKYDTIVEHELKKHKLIITLKENKTEVLEFKEENNAQEYDEKIEGIYKNAKDN